MSCTPFTWVAMATGTHWNATSVATGARTVTSFHHTLFEGSTHSTRPFHSKGDPYEVTNCTWRNTALTVPPSLRCWHTFFFFNIITVINSYFVDAVSLLCLITIRKKQKGQGQGILITWLVLWDFKSSSFLPCIDRRHIVLWKKKIDWFL